MARRLRIQFPGAIYHVINRGNYRRDVFENVGAAKAFEIALGETCERFRWQVHAYVIMRNHFHLAVGTLEPNLVDGMHWLQSTFATRFNRLRSERGHLFQGRYQALLIENAAALARVVDYVHLNPVRAGIVTAAQVSTFRWSSLVRFTKRDRPAWLVADRWLGSAGIEDSPDGWRTYVSELQQLAGDKGRQKELGFEGLSRGWAIGSECWRKAVAREQVHLTLDSGYSPEEIRELKEARWREKLSECLRSAGKTIEEAAKEPKAAAWKVETAAMLRRETGASPGWIARELSMGSPHSVRSYLSRSRRRSALNQQISA